jgi:hypothetical protein
MATVKEVQVVLKKIKELKYELVKIQEYESASIMREMEKRYSNKEVKTDKEIK